MFTINFYWSIHYLLGLQAGQEPTIETRRILISELIISLSQASNSSTSTQLDLTSSPSLLLPTLSILKHLGRNPAGSEELSRDKGIKVLLAYSGLSRVSSRPTLSTTSTSSSTRITESDPLLPYESESLRCLCNSLMLHPSARELFPELVLEEPSWVKGMISLLGVDGAGFLAGRILFLLTSTQGDSIVTMSEEGEVVKALAEVRLVFSFPRYCILANWLIPSLSLSVRRKISFNTSIIFQRFTHWRFYSHSLWYSTRTFQNGL